MTAETKEQQKIIVNKDLTTLLLINSVICCIKSDTKLAPAPLHSFMYVINPCSLDLHRPENYFCPMVLKFCIPQKEKVITFLTAHSLVFKIISMPVAFKACTFRMADSCYPKDQ